MAARAPRLFPGAAFARLGHAARIFNAIVRCGTSGAASLGLLNYEKPTPLPTRKQAHFMLRWSFFQSSSPLLPPPAVGPLNSPTSPSPPPPHRWKRCAPFFDESELCETFARGSGAGGQAMQKSNNCVHLQHLPSGIIVRCHATRSCETNRRLARRELTHRLDVLYNGAASARATAGAAAARREARRQQRASARHTAIAALRADVRAAAAVVASAEAAERQRLIDAAVRGRRRLNSEPPAAKSGRSDA